MAIRWDRAVLALAAALLRAPARADQDPVAQLKQDVSRLRPLAQKPADAETPGAAPSYAGERQAALAFVDLARARPDQRMEYCAYILRGADKRFRLSPLRQGDMNRCPSDRPKPAEAVATAHTHPLFGRDSDPSVAGQVFSEGDYEFAQSAEISLPIYLGAPAGHVLRYAPGHTFCKGETLIRRDFEVVRDLKPGVVGRLPVNPGAYLPLYDEGGRKIPKPAYCQAPPP